MQSSRNAQEVRTRRTVTRFAAMIVACAAVPGVVIAQNYEFAEVGESCGIGSYHMADGFCGGAAAADYDDDGDIDLFVPQAIGHPDLLYRNNGDGSFEEIGAQVGVASLWNSRAGLWVDYNGDGLLDLLVAHDNLADGASHRPLTLYRQTSSGAFEDVTASANLVFPPLTTHQAAGMCAGDINGDGYLDLCITQWDLNGGAQLLRNNGDGTFTDITDSSGLGETHGHGWQPMMHDFNGDGLQDIFIAIDFEENHLWVNQGDETFVDMADDVYLARPGWSEMGVAISDYDNDGRMDLYVTNLEQNGGLGYLHNSLYRNISTSSNWAYEDVSIDHGVDQGGWGWGVTFLDADLDGFVEIACTNGGPGPALNDQSKFFHNTAETFVDVSAAVGFNDTYWATCLLAVDFDRDGDLDMFQTCRNGPLRVLECSPVAARGVQNNWLVVKPRMSGKNRKAIGAVVKVVAGDLSMQRLIHAGCSSLGQEPAEAHFGCATESLVRVTIHWPDGVSTVIRDVPVNQVFEVVRPCPGDVTGDGDVGLADLLEIISNWGSDGSGGGDVNGDAAVDLADLLQVISNWGSSC